MGEYIKIYLLNNLDPHITSYYNRQSAGKILFNHSSLLGDHSAWRPRLSWNNGVGLSPTPGAWHMWSVPGSRAALHFLSAKSWSQGVLCVCDSHCCCYPGSSGPLQFALAPRCAQAEGGSLPSWVRILLAVCCHPTPASYFLTCLASDWPSYVPLLSRTPTSVLCPSRCAQVTAVHLLGFFSQHFGRGCLSLWFLVGTNSFRADSLGKTLLRNRPPSPGFFLPSAFKPPLLYLDGRNYCVYYMLLLGQLGWEKASKSLWKSLI